MSKYGETQTVLREEKFLVEVLKEMGYEIEVHPEGTQLNSYSSEQEGKLANIIIRRHELRGACGDIGFARQPDGRLTLIAVAEQVLQAHQAHLDFAVLGRFNEAQPSGLPLRTSRSQALRMLTSRYDVRDFGPQSVEVTSHPDGRAEVTGFPILGLPW
jgi:hypothetical protein